MEYRESEHIKISNVETDIDRAYNVLVDYVFDVGITKKNSLRLRLLTEEVLRLVKQIVGRNSVEMWFEGSKRVSHIVVESSSDLNKVQKEVLGSISSSGQIREEKGFFAKMAEHFLIQEQHESVWSLKEYQRQLKEKKAEDKYDEEAWEDLERSLVANLADDIEISSDKSKIRMVVTKDFSENLSLVSQNELLETTKQIVVGSSKSVQLALDRAEELVSELSLDKKDAFRAKLVFEETMGMLKAMTGDYNAVVWLERYKKSYCLKLTAKTEMSYDKKSELLSMAKSHKNDSIKGIMDKIGDVIQNSLLNYEHAINLNQQYNGGFIDYGSMGMYGNIEGLSEYGVMWSLDDYRTNLEAALDNEGGAKDAWDELEKSIIGNIADDVIVGVKGNRVDLTIICKNK
jgi:hypothetical protein